jgi:hypothetical protein
LGGFTVPTLFKFLTIIGGIVWVQNGKKKLNFIDRLSLF